MRSVSMSDLFLGVDTSNYTTSVAAVSADGEILANIKLPLPVKAGELGLRQQAALFEHTKNLPEAFSRFREAVSGQLLAVGVSEKPRNVEGSYMPCFLAGVSAATAAAGATRVPLYRFSHQCGHIRAAVAGSGAAVGRGRFAALHISGGTTELLLCCRSDRGYDCTVVGGTLDLCAGQAIDRAGVLLGFSFPCGKELDAASLSSDRPAPPFRTSVKGTYFNLSGLENLVKKEYAATKNKGSTSLLVLEFLSETLEKAIRALLEQYGEMPVICSGGVMSNTIIRRRLSAIRGTCFAPPILSADNAVGIAFLARDAFKNGMEE